jgi:hypothetical protein
MDFDTQSSSPPISLNCRMLLELMDASGQAEQREFRLVSTEQADLRSGLLDENSPLGRTLLGHHAGQVLPYRAGDLVQVRILAVQPADEPVSSEAAAKRRKDVRKAAAQSEITNQMIFSTASGSKWGDYDVDMDKLLDDDQ